MSEWIYDIDVEKYIFQGYITQFQEKLLKVKLSN